MIKKTIRVGLLAFASLLAFSACSSDDNSAPVEQGTSAVLPSAARSFVSEYFPEYTYNKVEKLNTANDNGATYVAIMKEGTEIQFDGNGQWVDIDGKGQVLPEAVINLLPATAVNYVEQNYTETTRSSIGKKIAILKLLYLKYGYQVDFHNGDGWLFDKVGEFLSNDKNSFHAGKVDKTALPQSSQSFIATHFAKNEYLYIAKLNIPYYGYIYNVYLSDNYKIKFDKNGDWQEIDRDHNAIDKAALNAILPEKLTTFVNTKYPSFGVESVEKKSDKYEVELTNDLDLEFDLQGNLTNSDEDNDEQKIDPTVLPQVAKDFIATAFPNANGYKEVSKNSVPDDGVMYEVRLKDNTQLELDTNGNWLEVKAKNGSLPQTFLSTLQTGITSYLNKNQLGIGVQKVKKDSKKQKVELINGVEIKFDLNGNFISIDR